MRVIGMHLDLSGLWRRRQMRAILEAIQRRPQKMPTILMGDTNEWRDAGACLKELNGSYRVAPTGPSFHSRRPIAALDRIIVDQRSGDRGGGCPRQRRSAQGKRSSADLGENRALSPATILRCRAALDRRADAHRLAIFDDGAAGGIHALVLEHGRDGVVAQDLELLVDDRT